MAIAFARPILFRGAPSRKFIQQLKARAPAPPTQAARINRPFNPLSKYIPPSVRPRPFEVPVVDVRGPIPPGTVRTADFQAAPAAPIPPPAPKPAGECATCGAAPKPAPAPAPALSAAVVSDFAPEPAPEPAALAAASVPGAPLVTTPKPSATGLVFGLGFVIVLAAVAAFLRPR